MQPLAQPSTWASWDRPSALSRLASSPAGRWRGLGLLGLAFSLWACGSGETSATPAEPGGPDGVGVGVPTGPGDGRFRQAFAKDGVGVTCEMTFEQMKASGAPFIESGSTTIFVGFQQYGNNQDPVFFRFDGGKKVYCEHHEMQAPDGRALGITWDGGPTAYVVYTIVGGGTALETAAKAGWLSRYGDGGGSSAVSVIGEVETHFGTLKRATFVTARRDNNTKTNTLRPAGALKVLADGSLEFIGHSAFGPLNPDKSAMCVPMVEYPAALDGAMGPSYLARFAPDLASVRCASTAGCSQVKTPCM
jgi:hypothetical protein